MIIEKIFKLLTGSCVCPVKTEEEKTNESVNNFIAMSCHRQNKIIFSFFVTFHKIVSLEERHREKTRRHDVKHEPNLHL